MRQHLPIRVNSARQASLWTIRLVILLFAAAAGLSIIAFVWLSDLALGAFWHLSRQQAWLPLLWTPLLTAGVVFVARRWFEGTLGSGIPQVMAALSPQAPKAQQTLFVGLRLALAKVVLTSGGLLAGLSSGREGPAVQIAASIMQQARRWLPARSRIQDNELLAAGGAAGVAAAFNTPLGGIMFAIEQLSRSTERRFSGLLITAIVLGGVMSVAWHGNSPYFGAIALEQELAHGITRFWWPATLLTLCCGLAGGLFSKLVVASLSGDASRISALRSRHPVLFAGACGLGVAIIGLVSGGDSFGSGYQTTRAMLEGSPPDNPLYTLLRALATWLTAWSGIPGGVFAPALSIGAGLGHDVGMLMGIDEHRTLIAIGMAAFLAAVTQAPLTSFIIVMEMVEGQHLVLVLMISTVVSSQLARTVSPSMYDALCRLQLARIGT